MVDAVPKRKNRRPHYMVTVDYAEPQRGYRLRLFCGCGIDPMSGRIVELFVRPARLRDGGGGREMPDHSDSLLERLCDDIGRLASFHLQAGVPAQRLASRLAAVARGPGCATFPGRSTEITGLSSPLGAIVAAAAIAQDEWSAMHEQLSRDSVVVAHA